MVQHIGAPIITESSLEIGQTVAINILIDTPTGWISCKASALICAHSQLGKVLEIQSYPEPPKPAEPEPEPEPIE